MGTGRVCKDSIHWPSIKVVGLVDQIGWSGTVGLGGLYFLHNSKSQQQRITNTQPNHQYITKNTKYTQNITNIEHIYTRISRVREEKARPAWEFRPWQRLDSNVAVRGRLDNESKRSNWEKNGKLEAMVAKNLRVRSGRWCAKTVVWEWGWDREAAVWLDWGAWLCNG